MARRLATLPPLWALALGLALHGAPLPAAVDHVLDRIGVSTVPLMMLSIGMSLEVRHWRRDLGLVGVVTAARLLLVPAAIYGLTAALHLPPEWRRVAVIQSAMPTMFFSLTLALLFRLQVDLVVNVIVLSTVSSFVTLPLWHWLLA
jgi:predicted permease